MYILKKAFLILVCLDLYITHLSAQVFDTASLKEEFDNSAVLKKHFFGFCLYDLDSNRFLMGENQDKYFAPASNAKIFTLFTALKNIGDSIPGLHYVERGDSLIFWGTGDPTFLHNRLDSRRVYNFLKNTSKKLYYVPNNQVEETFYRKGWFIDDFEEYYQPEISTFPIYGNVVTFRERNGMLWASPTYFQKDLQTSYAGEKEFTLSRPLNQNIFIKNKHIVPRNYINEKPFHYSDELFVKLLADTLKKQIATIRYTKPADYKTIFSNPTKLILREMMLPSDNFLAEQFQMMAALAKYGEFYTVQLREEMQSAYYTKFADSILLEDGSGLSGYNKVTPRSMVEILLLVDALVPHDEDLHRLFPTGGVDGTLRRTYALDNGEPFVWAKTGTINAVHNQSGFIKTRKGRNLVYSFLNTNFIGSENPIRREMARIVTFIRKNF